MDNNQIGSETSPNASRLSGARGSADESAGRFSGGKKFQSKYLQERDARKETQGSILN